MPSLPTVAWYYFTSLVVTTTGNNEIYKWEIVDAVDALNSDDTLYAKGRWSSASNFWFNASFYNEAQTNIKVGAWPNKTAYLGFRLTDQIDTLYGFINMTVGDYGSCDYTLNYSAIQQGSLSSSTQTKDIQSVRLYPNPTSGIFRLENTDIQSLEILDIYGKFIKKITVQDGSSVDISEFNPGIYFLRVRNKENEVHIDKLIKR
jgi:hypothetical protein